MYATYYGGLLNEQPSSLMVNGNNELFIVGRTNSTNFPTTSGVYGPSLNGGYDIIVGKFNSTGALLGSTYVGGTGDDCVNVNIGWNTYGNTKFTYADDGRADITLDANSNVYVAACTKSTDFPTSANNYQSAMGGTQDAVVFKMSSNLSTLDWSTYLGGTGTEAAYGIKLDNNNNVYVTGGSTGANFPTTSGVLNQTYQGGLTDGFISVFSPANSGSAQLLRSTFIGTSSYDQSFFIDIDASGDLYVFGQTQGTYQITGGCYNVPNSGQFIHKISGNLSTTIFSTTIGTGNNAVNLSPTAFSVDSCGTIYLAGWGRSSVMSASMPSPSTTSGLPVTTNAFQSTTDGRDFYIATLEPEAKGLFYATFFGEGASSPDADHLEAGTCRFDENGILYHAACASCGGSQGFPTTPGAYSNTNNSNSSGVYGCNAAVFKMDLSAMPYTGSLNAVGSGNCVPATFSFYSAGGFFSNLSWNFGDGSTSNQPNPTHTYTLAGTYTITLTVFDSIGVCGFIDSTQLSITIINCPTGVEELSVESISTYPNPTSGLITISHPSDAGEIMLNDVLGRCLFKTVAVPGSKTTSMYLSSAPSGIYFLQVRSEHGVAIKKVIKE